MNDSNSTIVPLVVSSDVENSDIMVVQSNGRDITVVPLLVSVDVNNTGSDSTVAQAPVRHFENRLVRIQKITAKIRNCVVKLEYTQTIAEILSIAAEYEKLMLEILNRKLEVHVPTYAEAKNETESSLMVLFEGETVEFRDCRKIRG